MQMDAAQGDPPALGAGGTHAASATASAEYQYPVDGMPGTNDIISGGGPFPQGRTDNGLLPDGGDGAAMEGMPSLPGDFGGDFQRPTGNDAHGGYDLQHQHMYYNAGFDQPMPRQMYAGMTKPGRPPMQPHPPTGFGSSPAGPRFPMMSGPSMAAQHGGPTPTLNQLLTQGQQQHQQKYGAGGTGSFMDFGPGVKGPGFDSNQPWGNVHGGMYPPSAYHQQQQQQPLQQQPKQLGPGMAQDARRTNGMPPPSYGQIPGQPQYGGPGQMAFLPSSPASGVPRRPPMSHLYGQQPSQGYPPSMSYGGQQVPPNPQLMYMQQQQERGMDEMSMDMQPGSMHIRSLPSPGGSGGHPGRSVGPAQSSSSTIPGGGGINSMPPMHRHHGGLGDGSQQQQQMHSHMHGHMMPPPSMMLGMNPAMGLAQRMATGSAAGSPAPPGMLSGGFGSTMAAPFSQPSYRPQGQPFPLQHQQAQPNAAGIGYPGPYQLEQQQQQPGGPAFGSARAGTAAAPAGGGSHLKSPSNTDVADKKIRKDGMLAGAGGQSHPLTPVAPSPGGNNSVASAGLDDVEDISSPSWPGTPTPRSVSSAGGGGGSSAAAVGSGGGSSAGAGGGNSTSECLIKIYEMGDEPGRRPFLDRLGALMDETGLPTGAMPQMSKQPLDLYKFYLTVKERGGFEQVSKRKLWKEIGNCIQIGASTYAAFTLKKAYLKYLLNYECKYDRNGLDPQTIISAMEAKAANAKKNSQKKKQAQAAAAASGQGTAPLDPSPSGSSTQCSEPQAQFRQQQPPAGLDPAAVAATGHGKFMPGFVMGRDQSAAPGAGDGAGHMQHGHYQQLQQQQMPPGMPMHAPPYMPLPDGGGSSSSSGVPGDGGGLSNGPMYPPPSSAQSSLGMHQGVTSMGSGEFGPAGRIRGGGSTPHGLGRPHTAIDGDQGQQQHLDTYTPVSAAAAAAAGQLMDSLGGGANGYVHHRGGAGASQDDWQQRMVPHAASMGGGYYGPQAGFGMTSQHGHTGHGVGAMFRPTGPFQPQSYPGPGQPMSSPSMTGGQPSAGLLGPSSYGTPVGGSFGMNFGQGRLSADGSMANMAGGGGSGDSWPPPLPTSSSGGGSSSYGARVSGASPLLPQQQQQQPWTPAPTGEVGVSGQPPLPPGSGSSSNSSGPTAPSSGPASAAASPGPAATPPSGWERQSQDTSSPDVCAEQQQQSAAAGAAQYPALPSTEATSGAAVADNSSASPASSSSSTPAPVQMQLPPPPSVDVTSATPDPSRQPWPSPQPSQLPRQQSSAVASSSPGPRGSSSMPPPGYAPPHPLPLLQQQQRQQLPQHQQQQLRGPDEAASARMSAQKVLGGSTRGSSGDVDFPPGSVEALQWRPVRRKVLYSKDIGAVDPWRLMMALKSGLLCESTWALDVLNILLHDDATVVYFNLLHLPGLLDVILEHYVRALTDVFSEFKCKGLSDSVEVAESDLDCDVAEHVRKQAKEPHDDSARVEAVAQRGSGNGRRAALTVVIAKPATRLAGVQQGAPTLPAAPPKHLARPPLAGAEDDAAAVGDRLRLPQQVWRTGQHLDHIVDVCHGADSAGFHKRLFYGARWPCRAASPSCLAADEAACEERVAAGSSPGSETGRDARAATAAAASDGSCKEPSATPLSPRKRRRSRVSNGGGCEEDGGVDGCSPPGLRRQQQRGCDGATAAAAIAVGAASSPEPFDGDEPVLAAAQDEGRAERASRCLCLSNIVRSLSFIPGNEKHLCGSSTLLAALGAVLQLGWTPYEQRRRGEEHGASEEERCWRWDCLDALREDALVTLSNVSGHLDLSVYDEGVCRPLLEAVLFWATSESAYARDAHALAACAGTFGASAAAGLSPRRLAVESMCKMCVHGSNVDLLLATPPWSRLVRLFAELVRLLADARGEPALRELAIVLISGFVQGGEGGAPARALVGAGAAAAAAAGSREPCVISLLLDFIEAAEQTAMHVAQSQGVHALRDNPEAMGTSVDMIRRVAAVLVTVAQVPDNRPLFARHQGRLLSLVMSQILDQHVSRLLSSVLFECAKPSSSSSSSS